MENIDCRSILDNQDADFYQLSTIVKNIREYLNSFKTDHEHIIVHSFEIPLQLVIPLQNLADLLIVLFNEAEINEAQKRYLTSCGRVIAIFYCYIHYFIELHVDKCKVAFTVDTSEQARRTAYEFYFNAIYELRTPYYLLKGYSEAQLFEPGSKNWEKIFGQIYSPPFVPENQDKIDKVSYWVEELGKFMDNLPGLLKEIRKDDVT